MINYESELIENQRKILTDNFNADIEEIKSNIVPNMLSNNELTLDLARKMIANLVVENADMQKRIYKTVKYMQNKYDNSDLCGFTISFNELEELKNILKVEIVEEEKKIPEKLNLDTDELRGKETPKAIDYLIESKINQVIDYLKSKGE